MNPDDCFYVPNEEESEKIIYDLTEDEKKPIKIQIKEERKKRIEKKIIKEYLRLEKKQQSYFKTKEEAEQYIKDLGLDLNIFNKYYWIKPSITQFGYLIQLRPIPNLTNYQKAERRIYNEEIYGKN